MEVRRTSLILNELEMVPGGAEMQFMDLAVNPLRLTVITFGQM